MSGANIPCQYCGGWSDDHHPWNKGVFCCPQSKKDWEFYEKHRKIGEPFDDILLKIDMDVDDCLYPGESLATNRERAKQLKVLFKELRRNIKKIQKIRIKT